MKYKIAFVCAVLTLLFLAHAPRVSAATLWPGTKWTPYDSVPVHMIVERGFYRGVEVHNRLHNYFSAFVEGNQTRNEATFEVDFTPAGSGCNLQGEGTYVQIFHPGKPDGSDHIGNCDAPRGIWMKYSQGTWHPELNATEYPIHIQLHINTEIGNDSRGYAYNVSSPQEPTVQFGVTADKEVVFIADKLQGSFTNMTIIQQPPCQSATLGKFSSYDYDNFTGSRAQSTATGTNPVSSGTYVPLTVSFNTIDTPSVGIATPGVPSGWSQRNVPGYGPRYEPDAPSATTREIWFPTNKMTKYTYNLNSVGRNNFIGLTLPWSGSPIPCPPTIVPRTLTSQTGAGYVQADQETNAFIGRTFFKDEILVIGYTGGTATVSYTIRQYVNTANRSCPALEDISSSSAAVKTGAVVWEREETWDRDTALRICHGIVITDSGGADVQASSDQRYFDIFGGDVRVGVSASPSATAIEVGQSIELTGWVRATHESSASYPLAYSITFTEISGLPAPPSSSTTVGTPANPSLSYNTGIIPSSIVSGSQLCVQVNVIYPMLNRYFNGQPAPAGRSARLCVTIINPKLPMFEVKNGDVIAGAGLMQGATCSGGMVIGATIGGWYKDQTHGSYTTNAALTPWFITGFATATPKEQVVTNSDFAMRPEQRLAFDIISVISPGTSLASLSTGFGGFLRPQQVPCILDYWVTPSTAVYSAEMPSATGVFKTGALAVGDTTIASGKRQTIYVDGNLQIVGNITNARAWSSIDDVSGIKFIVNGDVYIRNTVQRVDAIIAANNIYTCSITANTAADPGADFDACQTPLVIHGALVTKGTSGAKGRVYLSRTAGTVDDGNDTMAESITYAPEAWLARWPEATTTTSVQPYDAMSGLPPTL